MLELEELDVVFINFFIVVKDLLDAEVFIVGIRQISFEFCLESVDFNAESI